MSDRPRERVPVASWTLAAVLVAVAWQVTGFFPTPGDVLPYAWSKDAFARGDWAQLAVSAFVHGGLVHLMFNVLALVGFGPVVERRIGTARFLLLYVAAGVAGGLAHVLAPGSAMPVVGASGAIFGLLGALVILAPLAPVSLLGVIPMPLLLASALYVAAVPVLSMFTHILPVAHAAHLGGFAAGVAVAAALTPRRALRVAPAAAVVFAATWLGVGYALTLPLPWDLLALDWVVALELLWPVGVAAVAIGAALWDLARAGADRVAHVE